MSTVKISQLPVLVNLDANTANSLFMGVDKSSGVTGQFTARTLARGLYSNEILNVGNNQTFLPNTVAQFYASGNSYIQTNLVNSNDGGTADMVITANTGTDTTYFVDFGFANKDFVPGTEYNSLGTAIFPLDGYLYVQGDEGELGGNLTIGTTTSNTEIKFVAGGYNAGNVIAKIKHGGLYLVNDHTITFSDGSVQESSAIFAESFANGAFVMSNSSYAAANSGASFANGAFVTANSGATFANAAFTRANSGYGVANSGSSFANGAFVMSNSAYAAANSGATFANAAFLRANSAYAKANAALANTSGIFDGSLIITQNLDVNSSIKFANATFTSTQGLVTISASNTGATQPTGGDGYVLHMTGKHNIPVRVVSDSFGANGQLVFPLFGGRAARGNVTNPSAVQTGDVLTRIGASGFGETSYQSGGTSRIDFVATENHTDSARGTAIKFYNVQEGSNTLSEIASFNANTVTITGVVNPAKGFIYTPRILQGAQTAITIDFATDSMVRGTFSATVTNTLANYVAGKIVEVWLTNTAGNGQTVVHGCLANNSTIGATSLTIASGRSVYLKYFSISGDNANTFVAVTYA
jgi:hypothetical protein